VVNNYSWRKSPVRIGQEAGKAAETGLDELFCTAWEKELRFTAQKPGLAHARVSTQTAANPRHGSYKQNQLLFGDFLEEKGQRDQFH